jgi:hypothetical protein
VEVEVESWDTARRRKLRFMLHLPAPRSTTARLTKLAKPSSLKSGFFERFLQPSSRDVEAILIGPVVLRVVAPDPQA